MSQELDPIAIACALSEKQLRERKAKLFAQFNSAVIVTRELPHGYEFQIPADRKWIVTTAEFIAAERECCPFLTFELIAQAGERAITLRVTGPSGAKEFLNSMLCE